MESREYMESGILELYALDQLNPLERLEVENMAKKYPEISQELKGIQLAFEQFARNHAKEPREGLKNKIMEGLVFHEEIPGSSFFSAPIISMEPLNSTYTTNTSQEIKPAGKFISVRLYVLSLAACFVLLLVSTVSLLRIYRQLEEVQIKYLAALGNSTKYASETRFIKQAYQNNLIQQSDTNNVTLKLKGTKSYPGSVALVYWNKKDHHVQLLPHSLPQNDMKHSYQLWAIVNGKPVDEGTFDVGNSLASLNTMKDRDTAQAFAITLETKGGSPSPHLDQLVGLASI